MDNHVIGCELCDGDGDKNMILQKDPCFGFWLTNINQFTQMK